MFLVPSRLSLSSLSFIYVFNFPTNIFMTLLPRSIFLSRSSVFPLLLAFPDAPSNPINGLPPGPFMPLNCFAVIIVLDAGFLCKTSSQLKLSASSASCWAFWSTSPPWEAIVSALAALRNVSYCGLYFRRSLFLKYFSWSYSWHILINSSLGILTSPSSITSLFSSISLWSSGPAFFLPLLCRSWWGLISFLGDADRPADSGPFLMDDSPPSFFLNYYLSSSKFLHWDTSFLTWMVILSLLIGMCGILASISTLSRSIFLNLYWLPLSGLKNSLSIYDFKSRDFLALVFTNFICSCFAYFSRLSMIWAEYLSK